MSKRRWFLVVLGIFCAAMWLGCGDDDDDDDDNNDTNGNGNGNGGELVGTWKLTSITPSVGVLPNQTFTVQSNGNWTSTTTMEVPGFGTFTVTANGTSNVSGNKVTGTTTEVKIEPDLGFPVEASEPFDDTTTFEIDGNTLTVTSTSEDGAFTSTYEKQ